MTAHPYVRLFIKTVAPTATDDSAHGYEIGDFWRDTAGENSYRCLSVVVDDAVWVRSIDELNQEYLIAASGVPAGGDLIGFLDGTVFKVITFLDFEQLLATYYNVLYAAAANGVTNGNGHDHVGGDGATLTYATIGVKEKLTAARTYYVRTDGSDSNTGLVNSAGGAFLTPQKAVDIIAETLDIAGKIVTIQVGDGTYTGAITFKNVTGFAVPGNLVIQGNNGTPANVHINVTGNALVASNLNVVWDIKDLKITSTNISLYVLNSWVRYSNLNFAAATGAHIYCDAYGKAEAIGNYAVSGNSPYHWYLNGPHSYILTAGYTITFSNSPAFTTFAHGTILGAFFVHAMTFTNGGTVTGKRYEANLNSVIFTAGGGANYLPGNSAGTTATGGQYA